jgi:hypothetical protein
MKRCGRLALTGTCSSTGLTTPAPSRQLSAPWSAAPLEITCSWHGQTCQVVTVHVAADTITIDLDDQDTRTVRRTTTQPVRSIKAAQPRKAAHVS